MTLNNPNMDDLIARFLYEKRRVQGDDVARRTTIAKLQDGRYSISFPCKGGNCAAFLSDESLLKIMIDDLQKEQRIEL